MPYEVRRVDTISHTEWIKKNNEVQHVRVTFEGHSAGDARAGTMDIQSVCPHWLPRSISDTTMGGCAPRLCV